VYVVEAELSAERRVAQIEDVVVSQRLPPRLHEKSAAELVHGHAGYALGDAVQDAPRLVRAVEVAAGSPWGERREGTRRGRARAATEAGVSEGIRSKAAVGGERGDLGQSRARVGMPSSARTHVSSFPSTPVDEPGGSPPLRRGDGALRELGGARRRSERHRAHAEMASSSANASIREKWRTDR
jgi:hypothetical protein